MPHRRPGCRLFSGIPDLPGISLWHPCSMFGISCQYETQDMGLPQNIQFFHLFTRYSVSDAGQSSLPLQGSQGVNALKSPEQAVIPRTPFIPGPLQHACIAMEEYKSFQ